MWLNEGVLAGSSGEVSSLVSFSFFLFGFEMDIVANYSPCYETIACCSYFGLVYIIGEIKFALLLSA